jgi:amino acid transporter
MFRPGRWRMLRAPAPGDRRYPNGFPRRKAMAVAGGTDSGTGNLAKTLRWWDGVTINLAMPAALFVSLGYAMGYIGAWGAVVLWAVAASLATLHNWIYSEVASMFPDKSGGVSLYANEAWKRYSVFVGPFCTYAYWFAWSSGLTIYGLVIGSLIQDEWFSGATWSFSTGTVDFGLPHLIAVAVIFLGWALNIIGIRPAMWVMYVMGAVLAVPLLAFGVGTFLSGDWSTSGMHWSLSASGAEWRVALAWLFIMAWSVYGVEATASFVPEFKDTVRDTRLALRGSAILVLAIFILVPLGLGGYASEKAALDDPTTFYVSSFENLVGGAGQLMTLCLIAGLLLLMMMTTADGGRVLSAASRDRLTIKGLGVLNRHNVPGRAMTLDLVVNILLVLFLGNPLAVIVAGNVGYVLMHFFAVSGFLLLRRDRPTWPRPIRVARFWLPVACALAISDLLLVFVGATSASITGYGGSKELLIAVGVLSISILLYLFRRVIQDGERPLRLRDEAPDTLPVDPSTPEPTLVA